MLITSGCLTIFLSVFGDLDLMSKLQARRGGKNVKLGFLSLNSNRIAFRPYTSVTCMGKIMRKMLFVTPPNPHPPPGDF